MEIPPPPPVVVGVELAEHPDIQEFIPALMVSIVGEWGGVHRLLSLADAAELARQLPPKIAELAAGIASMGSPVPDDIASLVGPLDTDERNTPDE